MLMQTATRNNLLHSCSAGDALAGVWDKVVDDMSAEALCIIGFMTVPLAGRTPGLGVNMLTGARIVVLIVAIIVLEMVVRVSYALDFRAAVIVDVFVVTKFCNVFGIGVDVLADADAYTCAVTTIALGCIPTLVSPEEALLLSWKSCSCSPTATWNCRALQLAIPSYHVWAKFAFSAFPQLPNQEPPWAQQLNLPDFLMMPHAGQTGLIDVVVTGVSMWTMILKTRQK